MEEQSHWRTFDAVQKPGMPLELLPTDVVEVELINGVHKTATATSLDWTNHVEFPVLAWRYAKKPEFDKKAYVAKDRWEVHTHGNERPASLGVNARVDVIESNWVMHTNALQAQQNWAAVKYWRFASPGSPQSHRRIAPLLPHQIIYRCSMTGHEISEAEWLAQSVKKAPVTPTKGEPAPEGLQKVLESQVSGNHYKKHGAYQPWEVLRRWMTPEEMRGFMKGQAIVYLARERDKNGLEDLEKAKHYIEALIEFEKAGAP